MAPVIPEPNGRFAKGHEPIPGAHRPKGALNVITKSLREQAIEDLGDIAEFVRELKQSNPAAAAGLLARLMPPGDVPESEGGHRVTQIDVVSIPTGKYLSHEEAASLASWSASTMMGSAR
jgi:hypothetical protein